VELQVTVAELNRTAIEQQGFDFRFEAGSVVVTGRPGKIPVLGNIGQIVGSEGIDNDRLTFAVLDRNNNFATFIELLQRESLAKVLARPSLLSRSGEEAHFRSGGEQPIPLITSNQVAVQFKEFGTIVNFTPTFTDDGGIDLRVDAELSQPDFSRAPVVNGIQVPSFVSRQANTRVRLREQQSLLIAGLLSDNETEDEQKVPYLGDIPYLGALFRRTSFNHTRSELMILVQPRVVTADRNDATVPLPTGGPPLTRRNVRTKPTPNPVTRPRLFGSVPAVPAPPGGPPLDETE
jgi:pilus assembly protein CpaC